MRAHSSMSSLEARAGRTLKIYFHSPRAFGRPLVGKRARKFEAAGFESCSRVAATTDPGQADLIYLRNIPEATSDSARRELAAFLRDHRDKKIVNPPEGMQLHDAKDRSFEAWSAAHVPVPAARVCARAEQALEFAREWPHFFLRLNNEACGDDTTLLRAADDAAIARAFARLDKRARRSARAGRGETRVVAVALEGERDEAGLARFWRVFLVGERLFGGYALVSRDDVVHMSNSCCESPAELESFLASNSVLDALVADRAFQQLAARALATLRLDVGCLDFVMARGAPCFLEANALWSPSFAWAGGKAGQAHYLARPDLWRQRAASYCAWMDRVGFYRTMYEQFPALLGW